MFDDPWLADQPGARHAPRRNTSDTPNAGTGRPDTSSLFMGVDVDPLTIGLLALSCTAPFLVIVAFMIGKRCYRYESNHANIFNKIQ